MLFLYGILSNPNKYEDICKLRCIPYQTYVGKKLVWILVDNCLTNFFQGMVEMR